MNPSSRRCQTFGGDGFDIYREKVEAIEKQLGIYDLAQFTAKRPLIP